MIKLINSNNIAVNIEKIDLLYADMIFDNCNLSWISHYWGMLRDNGIFICQTDYHMVADKKIYLDSMKSAKFVNWVIYKQEWGGVPAMGFAQKHDDILIYCKGKNYKWHGERIQIPKKTAWTAFDKKGTGTKTPCSVFDDLGNFSTMSNERIKTEDGHNIRWQKSLKLMNRLLLPFTDDGDLVVDPFMGSGTTGVWCKENNRNFIGIEIEKEIYDIAKKRINNE
jgi:DNA modification methylase